ncbi:unnamed protein product [Lathyrus sativus]|nr:unnamed protein product [Lathyrus sativus]
MLYHTLFILHFFLFITFILPSLSLLHKTSHSLVMLLSQTPPLVSPNKNSPVFLLQLLEREEPSTSTLFVFLIP